MASKPTKPIPAIIVSKKDIAMMLSLYESGVKTKEEIGPFLDGYFERQRRLNTACK
jgi:hypothetical protein